MRKATAGAVAALQAGSSAGMFMYGPNPAGDPNPSNMSLFFSPVHFAPTVPAVAASAKSLIFGNFEFMGYREVGLSMQRNPFKTQGIVYLEYHYYIKYAVTQAEAIRYGTHTSA